MYVVASSSFPLYLIEILHQTTTDLSIACLYCGCILLKFYIKPQQHAECLVKSYCCILLKFYIKPQRTVLPLPPEHRCILLKFYIKPQLLRILSMCHMRCILLKFYIKPQPASTTPATNSCCILLKFYIKPQQDGRADRRGRSCILLKFYIKPQRRVRYLLDFSVLRRLSGRKTERENSVEVSLMCFLYFKERKYCFFRKIPTAAACPVLPVRSCPRS